MADSVKKMLAVSECAAENQPDDPEIPPMPSGMVREGDGRRLFTAAAGEAAGLPEDINDGEQVITSGLPLAESVRKMVEVNMSRDFSHMFLWELSRVLTFERML
jgi:hypothetical protein